MVATAYVLISARTGTEKQVYKELEKLDGVYQVDAVFGPYDIIAIIQAPDYDKLGEVILEKIIKIDGIKDTITCNVIHIES